MGPGRAGPRRGYRPLPGRDGPARGGPGFAAARPGVAGRGRRSRVGRGAGWWVRCRARWMRASRPPAVRSCPWRTPCSTMRPASRTTMWSACANAASRVEHSTIVARCSAGAPGPVYARRAATTSASVATSTAENGSSSTSSRGWACGAARARARAMRWRCPPETRTPSSPIWVWSPSGQPARSSRSPATRTACSMRPGRLSTSARVISVRVMLSRTVPEKTGWPCGRYPRNWRSVAVQSCGSRPSTSTCPPATGYRPAIASARADLPEATGPVTASIVPGDTVRLMPRSAGWAAPG